MIKSKKEIPITFMAFIATILIVFVVATFLLVNKADTNAKYRVRAIAYNNGWTLVNGESETPVESLPIKITTAASDVSVLKKTLPDVIHENDAIALRNYHQLLHVRIGDDLIFAYPNLGWNGIGNIISDEWLIVNIDPEYAGEIVEVHYTNSAAYKISAYMGDFYYGNDNDLIQHIRKITFKPYMLSLIVCIFAVVLLIISAVYSGPTNQKPNMAMGAGLLCFGIWLTNRAKMPLFPEVSSALYLFAVLALMFVAPCICLYSYYRNIDYRFISWKAYWACIIIDVFLVLSCIVIRYNAETIAQISYLLCFVALMLNTYPLIKASFGKKANLRTRIELMLDRSEFFADLIIPVAAIIETAIYRKMLWTEASMFLRTALLIFTISYMVFVFWRTYLVVTDRAVVTKKLQENQLKLLIDQIQPHFLFNTLSAIRVLIKVEPDTAYDAMYDFSKYLRANIDNVNNIEGIDFASEVEHIKSYVNIEKLRFGERISAEYDIQCDDFFVPPLSIQGLIENAIQHGILPKIRGGKIWLRSYETNDYDVVEVEDNGVGFNRNTAAYLFSIYASDDDKVGLESNNVMVAAMTDIMENLRLTDETGNPIVFTTPIKNDDLSEEHQTSKTMNIFLRLREMSGAKIEIESTEGSGTLIRVLIPKF